MSSIMDALKKSDAKRPRSNHGQKIHMDLKNHRGKKTKPGFYALILFLLLILAAVYFRQPAFIWNQFTVKQSTESGQIDTKQVNQVVPVKPATESGKKAKLNKPTPEQVQTAAANKKQSTKSGPTNTESIAKTEQQIKPGTSAQTKKNNTKPDNDPVQNKINNQSNTATQQAVDEPVKIIDQQLSETPMKNKQAINKSTEESVQDSASPKEYIQFFQLPFQIRKDIPKLSLSVHIYDPVVENRMAIINGIPVHVGDKIEELLTIQDITQTGVVLRVQNRDFILLK